MERKKEEIIHMREKLKVIHSEKLLSDKKVAEILTVNSRLEVSENTLHNVLFADSSLV